MTVVFEWRRGSGDGPIKCLRRLAAHAIPREAVARMERLDVIGRRLPKRHRLGLASVDGSEQAARHQLVHQVVGPIQPVRGEALDHGAKCVGPGRRGDVSVHDGQQAGGGEH